MIGSYFIFIFIFFKAVEATLQEATVKIKDALSGELEQIMKRLEEYQASHKLLAAKALKDGSTRVRYAVL